MAEHPARARVARIQETQVRGPLVWIGSRDGARLSDRALFECTRGDEVSWTAAVLIEGTSPFEAAFIWEAADLAVLGGGEAVYLLHLSNGAVSGRISCDGYFGAAHLLPAGELLVLSMTEAILVSADGREKWRATGLAVDGVVLGELLEGDRARFEVEMDPPGGWQTLTLDLREGRRAR